MDKIREQLEHAQRQIRDATGQVARRQREGRLEDQVNVVRQTNLERAVNTGSPGSLNATSNVQHVRIRQRPGRQALEERADGTSPD